MNNTIQYRILPSYRVHHLIQTLSSRSLFILILMICLLLACEKVENEPEGTVQFGSEKALVQEISFTSDRFTIVGDLRLPVKGDLHPVILMIHGSGEATRNGAVPFTPMIEIFLRNGFAVFSWDKPGSGESKGEFYPQHELSENAKIVADAIEALADIPSIDLSKVGLWGISQAGWIMPLALEMTDKISFMIVVSGGGEDGIEQGAYQIAQRIACDGGSQEDVAAVEHYWAVMNKATNYEEYSNAAQILLDISGVFELTGLILSEEENWSPWSFGFEALFDPLQVLQRTTIPVLAFFGELDKNIDPIQGTQAYNAALKSAGNPDYKVVVIEGAGHVMVQVETGCIGEFVGREYMSEYLETLELWLMDR